MKKRRYRKSPPNGKGRTPKKQKKENGQGAIPHSNLRIQPRIANLRTALRRRPPPRPGTAASSHGRRRRRRDHQQAAAGEREEVRHVHGEVREELSDEEGVSAPPRDFCQKFDQGGGAPGARSDRRARRHAVLGPVGGGVRADVYGRQRWSRRSGGAAGEESGGGDDGGGSGGVAGEV